jgi:hypothetical protein
MDRSKRSTVTTLSGVAIAAAAAGLFISQTVAPAAAADAVKIQCSGVNSCKGKSECKGGNNSCKGKNSCKGQGWQSLDEKSCKAKGGVVIEKP